MPKIEINVPIDPMLGFDRGMIEWQANGLTLRFAMDKANALWTAEFLVRYWKHLCALQGRQPTQEEAEAFAALRETMITTFKGEAK